MTQAPSNEQIITMLDSLQKGDSLALNWARPETNPNSAAVAYLRVSSKRQLDGEGLPDQWRACQMAAERSHLELVGLYVDPAISGRKDSRPAIDQLRTDVKRKRFKTILFYRVNRIGRNARQSYQLAEEFERVGCRVMSASEHFDRGNAAGNLTFGMLVTFAQFGSDQLSEVMKDTLASKAKRGEWVGPVPIGYERDGKTLRFSEDKDCIEQLGLLYATGNYSYDTLADKLNASGFRAKDWRTGERYLFGRETIRGILKNKAYIGIVTCNGVEYQGQHPPIWSQDTWDNIDRIRNLRKNTIGRVRKPTHGKNIGRMLSGVAYCAGCGSPMWVHLGGGGKGRAPIMYYVCSGRDHRICNQPLVRADKTEHQVLEEIAKFTLPDPLRQKILEYAVQHLNKKREADSKPVITAEMIQKQRERLALVWASGDLPDEVYHAQRERLLKQEKELGKQQLRSSDGLTRGKLEDAINNMANLRQVADLDLTLQRAMVRKLFDRVWLEPHEVKATTPTSLYLEFAGVIGALCERNTGAQDEKLKSVGRMGWLTGLEPATT
jgi:site-specific DNA recombinase